MTGSTNNPVLAVVGAGAAGIMAAVTAANEIRKNGKNVRIVLFDGNEKIGKKLYATGNGKCNLSNTDLSADHYFGSSELLNSVYEAVPSDEVMNAFLDIGLEPLIDDAGRIYPRSRVASSVVSLLEAACAGLNVEFRPGIKIRQLRPSGKGWLLNNSYYADKLILACGGASSPAHGTDGGVFSLLNDLQIQYTEPVPALVPLVVSGFPKNLKGVRAQGRIAAISSGNVIAEDSGEIQYAEYGLSGIPSMNISGRIARCLFDGKSVEVTVDSLPDVSFYSWKERLSSLRHSAPGLPVDAYLSSLLPSALARYFMRNAQIPEQTAMCDLQMKDLRALWRELKDKKYTVSSVKDFSLSQVTSGGVDEREVDPNTLELKKCKGIYLVGETLNVDGVCGGYNLHWAWATGILAGKSCVMELFL